MTSASLRLKKAKEERDRRNKEIAKDVKNGEYTPPAINTMEMWFPKRPKPVKDLRALNKLYGESND